MVHATYYILFFLLYWTMYDHLNSLKSCPTWKFAWAHSLFHTTVELPFKNYNGFIRVLEIKATQLEKNTFI